MGGWFEERRFSEETNDYTTNTQDYGCGKTMEQKRHPKNVLLSPALGCSLPPLFPLRKAYWKEPHPRQASNSNTVMQYINMNFTEGLRGCGLPEQSQAGMAKSHRVDISKYSRC